MSESAPTPWEMDGNIILDDNAGTVADVFHADDDVAALIVRAVNAHAGLIRMALQVGGWLEARRLEASQAAEERDDRSLQDFILGTMPDGFTDTLNSVSAALEAEREMCP